MGSITDPETMSFVLMAGDPNNTEPLFLKDKVYNQGWVYRDMSGWVSLEDWERLLRIFGENEFYILAQTIDRKINRTRGQILLSPKAIKNMTDSVLKNRKN